MDMIIPIFKKYARNAAIATVLIVAAIVMFGSEDEEMMYFHVNGQTIAVPVSGQAAGGWSNC
jgi:hypothetical protein